MRPFFLFKSEFGTNEEGSEKQFYFFIWPYGPCFKSTNKPFPVSLKII